MPGPATPAERPPTIVESALQSDRAPAVLLLVLLPLICWMWVVVMARDMYGPMTGASAWMMTANWDVPHLLLLWAMWTVMMTGMMLHPPHLWYCCSAPSRDDPHMQRQGTRFTRSPPAISSSGRFSALGQPRFSVVLRRSWLCHR